jgi:hypothetical protein
MNCKYSDLDLDMRQIVEERFRAYIRVPRK